MAQDVIINTVEYEGIDQVVLPTREGGEANFIEAGIIPHPSDANPLMDGSASAGSSNDYSRADHVHPSDSTKADASNVYTKTEVDTALSGKADSSAVYTKTETDTLLSGKASASDLEELEEEMTDYRQMYLDSLIHTTASGSIASFSDGFKDAPMDFCTATIEPKQEGSGDPSPTNVRPISGWTGAEVVRAGANVFGGQTMLDTFYAVAADAQKDETAHTVSFVGRGQKVFFSKFKPNTRYIFILTLQHTASNTATNLQCHYTDGTFAYIDKVANTNKQTIVFTSTNGKSVAYLGSVNAGGTTTLYCEESGIFEGVLTASDFEPYDGTTYSVTWESEAGTVYGGSVDLVSGSLNVTMGYIASYNGETIGEPWISDRDEYVVGTTPSIGAEVAYTLATPTTYQLTPQEITTLLGSNNVWADTGDTSVGYVANTKLYIDSKLS